MKAEEFLTGVAEQKYGAEFFPVEHLRWLACKAWNLTLDISGAFLAVAALSRASHLLLSLAAQIALIVSSCRWPFGGIMLAL